MFAASRSEILKIEPPKAFQRMLITNTAVGCKSGLSSLRVFGHQARGELRQQAMWSAASRHAADGIPVHDLAL